ncbi:ComF family protein [Leucobacter sp. W1478]|uniref:ComF family protein n=1 Tax=Leucobacter sp. W1478 TaxID=3439065 RepID=UPI003F38D453
MFHWFRELGLDALALLWPTQCVTCGAPDRDCCDACRVAVRDGRGTAIWVRTPAGLAACVAGPYEGSLRDLLVAFKHAGQTGFARELGPRLAAPLDAALSLAGGPTLPLLVTVPSRSARVRERGYRHVDMLVRAALRSPCFAPRRPWLVTRALRARRGRTSQVGLSATERQYNAALVEVSPVARNLLRGREVVLVDDVVTTGATIAAAHLALTLAGARVVATVALCAVERRSDRLGARRSGSNSETGSGRREAGPNDP